MKKVFYFLVVAGIVGGTAVNIRPSVKPPTPPKPLRFILDLEPKEAMTGLLKHSNDIHKYAYAELYYIYKMFNNKEAALKDEEHSITIAPSASENLNFVNFKNKKLKPAVKKEAPAINAKTSELKKLVQKYQKNMNGVLPPDKELRDLFDEWTTYILDTKGTVPSPAADKKTAPEITKKLLTTKPPLPSKAGRDLKKLTESLAALENLQPNPNT